MMIDELYERIARLEAAVAQLTARASNSVSRGTMTAANDSGGMQMHTVSGYYGEELDKLPVWQPFGLSATCPAGGDALIACIGGNRDGAQVVAVSHPSYRPTGTAEGETVLYDAYGQRVALGASGITITDRYGNSVSMGVSGITLTAARVEIQSGTLTHNGTNIGATHVHSGVVAGVGNTGGPQ